MLLIFFLPKPWPQPAILGKARILSCDHQCHVPKMQLPPSPLLSSRFKSQVIHKTFSDFPSPKLTPFSKIIKTVLSNNIFDMDITILDYLLPIHLKFRSRYILFPQLN